MLALQPEVTMARKSKLTRVAVKIGAAMGRADRKGHQIAKAGVLANKSSPTFPSKSTPSSANC